MKRLKTPPKSLIIYQSASGSLEFRGDTRGQTMWASLQQIADLFETDKSGISRHIKKIFGSGELKSDSVVAFFATTGSDGKVYQVEHFNLDVMISVGYRVNSQMATQFRIWATKTLKSYLTDGFVIDRKKVKTNYEKFFKSVETLKLLAPAECLFGLCSSFLRRQESPTSKQQVFFRTTESLTFAVIASNTPFTHLIPASAGMT